jgi:UDP-N-acetylmuramate--alanine ligase
MDYKYIYFIGIGGIGMSALARYCKGAGHSVSGYDKTPSPLTEQLASEGIGVHYCDDPSLVPADKENTLVGYTPAIPDDLGEMVFVRENGYKMVKRSRMLGEICVGKRCLAVAGTHGKTSTSTLAAHILSSAGKDCSAFLGGISRNYGTNLIAGRGDIVVAEADEFDRSFLQLHPEVAVITSMDADHLDIYGDIETLREAFREFASQTSGTIILKNGLPITEKDTPARILTYHLDDPGAWFHGENFRTLPSGRCMFDLRCGKDLIIKDMACGVPGWVYAENSIAAAAATLCMGASPDEVKAAVDSYEGVKRRLEFHFNRDGVTYIDDYAHHPRELSATISSVRSMFPGRKITAVFQPHLYTRTRDFAQEFAESLSLVDKLILLDIYPARELPIEGVTSELILRNVTAPEKVLISKEKLMDYLEKEDIDILVTFGAGDIDRFTGEITRMLEKRQAR